MFLPLVTVTMVLLLSLDTATTITLLGGFRPLHTSTADNVGISPGYGVLVYLAVAIGRRALFSDIL